MPRVLQSRKLWAAIVGLVFIVVNAALNQQQIDPDTVTNAVMGIVAAYMAATAWEDGQKAKATAAPTTTIETPATNVAVTTSDTPTPPQPMAGGRMGM
jgi:hypothetical protein